MTIMVTIHIYAKEKMIFIFTWPGKEGGIKGGTHGITSIEGNFGYDLQYN